MVSDQIKLGESRPRFQCLNENAADHPRLGLYAIGLFMLAAIPIGALGGLFGEGPVAVLYLVGVTAYGSLQEFRRGYDTIPTLIWRTINLRHFALGEIYLLDRLRAIISRRRGQ